MFEIEKGVPIPGRGGKALFPWDEMKPGMSFFIPETDDNAKQRFQAAAISSGRVWCKKNQPDWKVVTRRLEEGVRVWLVEREG